MTVRHFFNRQMVHIISHYLNRSLYELHIFSFLNTYIYLGIDIIWWFLECFPFVVMLVGTWYFMVTLIWWYPCLWQNTTKLLLNLILTCLMNISVYIQSSPSKILRDTLFVQSSKLVPLTWNFKHDLLLVDKVGPLKVTFLHIYQFSPSLYFQSCIFSLFVTIFGKASF